jgi:hypothetical protein
MTPEAHALLGGLKKAGLQVEVVPFWELLPGNGKE